MILESKIDGFGIPWHLGRSGLFGRDGKGVLVDIQHNLDHPVDGVAEGSHIQARGKQGNEESERKRGPEV